MAKAKKGTDAASPLRVAPAGQASPLTYVLRTCSADLTSYHGSFQWPASGPVSCPDWSATAECGNGLHGLLMGEGDGSLLDWSDDAKWLVVEVESALIVDISAKVKFPRGNVVFCGGRHEAVDFILAKGADPSKCVGGTATAGDRGTATAGDSGTATAGYSGTATAGYSGTVSGQANSILCVKWYDNNADRSRLAIAYVGEDGIEPGVKYRLDRNNKFVAA